MLVISFCQGQCPRGLQSNTGKEPGPLGDHVEQSCCHPLPSEPLQERRFCL